MIYNLCVTPQKHAENERTKESEVKISGKSCIYLFIKIS